MSIHGNGNKDNTLVNALLFRYKDKLSLVGGEIRPGIVHRIDKDTSGILVIAKNDNVHKLLSEMFKIHDIKREYIALVSGVIKKDKIKISLPIGRSSKDRKKMTVTMKNSKPAITNIEVLKRYKDYTLIKANLETGRTHQIRVHLSHIGHSIVGDLVYGKKDKLIKEEGQFLHAKTLGFIHPITKKYIEFNEDIPKYFKDILDMLENNN